MALNFECRINEKRTLSDCFFWRFCPLGSWKVEILHAWYLYTYYNSDSILQYFELFYMCWMWL